MTHSLSSGVNPGLVTGVFESKDDAECAYQAAIDLGYEKADINLMMSEETRKRCFPDDGAAENSLADQALETSREAPKGAEMGGPIGGTVGTIAPVLAAVGTLLLVPGLVIAGPIAVALTAAGTVGIAGGLAGVLIDWGIPKGRVRHYEQDIRDGGILIGIKARSQEDARRLEQAWQACGVRSARADSSTMD